MTHEDMARLLAERDWIAANAPHLVNALHLIDKWKEHYFASYPATVIVAGRAVVRGMFMKTAADDPHTQPECEIVEGMIDLNRPIRVMRGEQELFRGVLSRITQGGELYQQAHCGQKFLARVVGFSNFLKGDVVESLHGGAANA